MPKPSDDLTDEQLHQGLTTGEYQGRDAWWRKNFYVDGMRNVLELANIGLVSSAPLLQPHYYG